MEDLWWKLLSVVLVAFAVTACSRAAPDREKTAGPPTTQVEISNLKFVPAELHVRPGTKVIWTNTDPVDHDVTSGVSVNGRQTRDMKQTKFPDGKFSSGLFGAQKTFTYIFKTKGEFDYYCNVHPFMTAKVVVE